MREITQAQFPGTTEQLQARIDAFQQALDDHAATVGVPAPREDDWVEELARTGEPFEVMQPPAPTPPLTQEDLRAAAHARINFARDMAMAAGAVVQGKTYQTDPRSVALLTSTLVAFQAGVPIPGGFSWRAADNSDTPISSTAELGEIAAAALELGWAAHERARTLKAQIDALPDGSTQADFDAVKW